MTTIETQRDTLIATLRANVATANAARKNLHALRKQAGTDHAATYGAEQWVRDAAAATHASLNSAYDNACDALDDAESRLEMVCTAFGVAV